MDSRAGATATIDEGLPARSESGVGYAVGELCSQDKHPSYVQPTLIAAADFTPEKREMKCRGLR